MSLNSCTECGARLSSQAETCPDCGYPASSRTNAAHGDIADSIHSTRKEYKLIQLLGAIVVLVGVVAALLESPIAAAVSIAIGAATYLTGLLGSWWNRSE